MNRNKISHFSETPVVKSQRSVFDIFHDHKTTADAGKLYPFFDFDILPGDTIHLDNSILCRMATPIFPVLDNAYLDTYFFFVPNRLVYDGWKTLCGENDESSWAVTENVVLPTIRGVFSSGSIFDHFGDPIGVNISVDSLNYRMYQLIWNEWFRNQNLQDPLLINKGLIVDEIASPIKQKVLPVNRFRDYFSSCLPAPQKGESVSIPLQGTIPVYATSTINPFFADDDTDLPAGEGLKWFMRGGDIMNGEWYPTGTYAVNAGNSGNSFYGNAAVDVGAAKTGVTSHVVSPANLKAFLDYGQGFASINSLRQAFQIQRMLELDSRSGTRYVEILRSHFNVIAPDASLQRPEYLGGRRIPLSVNQVLQTSSTDSTSPLGQTGAFSKTVDSSPIFKKSFTEHGRIIGVFCIRTDRSYQQGIRRSHSRRTRYDFYWPALAHIGEQAVLRKEIYANGSDQDDLVFGYQEAWAEYRNHPNIVSGGFRENYVGGAGLNAWHYADWYTSPPELSDQWMQEGDANIDRTLAVSNDNQIDSQFYLDAYFKIKAARPMPLYSVPGLIDHF